MRKSIKRILIIALILIIFFVPKVNAATDTYEFTVKGTRDYEKAYEVAKQVNAERKKAGLSELKLDKTLMDCAMKRAAELVAYYSPQHYRPNDEECYTILPEGSWTSMGENIAAYQTSSTEVMTAWMNSESHRKNILEDGTPDAEGKVANFNSMGIGCFKSELGYYYWVQIFTCATSVTLEQTQTNRFVQETVELKNGRLPFWDVENSDYYFNAICYNVARKYILGYNANVFGPKDKMNRAMFVTILWRMEGEPNISGNKTLSDIKAGEYYEKAVKWAVNTGVVNGYADGTFKPNRNISRQDIVVILRNYLQYKGVNVSVKKNGTYEGFVDTNKVDSYAKDSVMWAVENKIINGKTQNNKKYIDPQGVSIRGDVACILYNYGQSYLN